jgi:hypothetical protein
VQEESFLTPLWFLQDAFGLLRSRGRRYADLSVGTLDAHFVEGRTGPAGRERVVHGCSGLPGARRRCVKGWGGTRC